NDGYAKVTGRARYTDDLKFHNMAHAVPVYSGCVHAENLRIDTSRALQSPGVLKVLTAADVPGKVSYGQIEEDYPMFVAGRINCSGDMVALIVAGTRREALDAVPLVKVTADPLPGVFDPGEALGPGSPIVRDSADSNLMNHHRMRRGEAEDVLPACPYILDEKFSTQYIEHAYMEPEAAVCVPRQDGVIEVYGSMQHPFSTRRFVAALLGEPLSNIEVYQPPMGGGFGGKDDTAAIVCARAALAARLLDRPVKLTYTREWSMRESYKRHPYRMHYRVGLDEDGRVRAVITAMISDGGPYLSVSPWVNWRSTAQCFGPYSVDHVHADVYCVATNNPVTGAMRGFGAPQVNFAVEQIADIAAEKVGISPLEFRRRNMVRQDGETVTGQVLNTHTVSMEEVMDAVAHEIGYEEKLARSSRGRSDTDELYGIGLAISYRGASLGAEGMDFCSAVVNCQYDGSILLETGIHENGQGSESVMMLFLAEELGVDLNRIRYKRPSTSNVPDGGTTVATRGTIMGGGAVKAAADRLKRLIAEEVCGVLNCRPEEVRFTGDRVRGPGPAGEGPGSEEGPAGEAGAERSAPDSSAAPRSLSWEETMEYLYSRRIYPYAFGSFQAPDVSWDEETGQGDAYFTYVYSCQAVELTVHRRSGAIKLQRIVAAHDIGRAINRAMVFGQLYGGVAQGIGMALTENLDIEGGEIIHPDLNRYRIPRAKDIPEIKGIIVENPDPQSPTGAKGIGEPALELIAPAIANAVYNATGIRYRDLPIKVNPEDLA
ncbi:MAG: xanthine dehydrogenase family protein molybdopterin-binding subunit, partial [Sediminispirochaetaceae bacterium]